MARLGHWMLLFAIILIFAENIKCEEEEEIPKISGVTRLRHEFRACQGSLEDCNDRYEECQVEKRSTDEDLQSQLTRLKGQEALAQVCDSSMNHSPQLFPVLGEKSHVFSPTPFSFDHRLFYCLTRSGDAIEITEPSRPFFFSHFKHCVSL